MVRGPRGQYRSQPKVAFFQVGARADHGCRIPFAVVLRSSPTTGMWEAVSAAQDAQSAFLFGFRQRTIASSAMADASRRDAGTTLVSVSKRFMRLSMRIGSSLAPATASAALPLGLSGRSRSCGWPPRDHLVVHGGWHFGRHCPYCFRLVGRTAAAALVAALCCSIAAVALRTFSL